MELLVIDWWWKNHQSSTHEGLRLFGFCNVPWEDVRKPSIERSTGTKIGMDEIFSKSQKLWQNQWRPDGIRMEHLRKSHNSSMKKEIKRFLCWNQMRHQKILQAESHSCRCSTTFLLNQKDNEKECLANAHPLVLVLRKSGTVSRQSTGRLGQKLQSKWCSQLQETHTQYSDPRIHHHQLRIHGTFSECEEWHWQWKNKATIRPIVRAKWDENTHLWPMILHNQKKIYCSNVENELKKQIEQILYWCRIYDHSWNRTVFHDERHFRFFTMSCSGPREEAAPQPKDGSRGTQRLDLYWKLHPVICTVNMELRSEFGPWTDTILTLGTEFLMDQTSLRWIWTTTKQKFPKISSKNMR